jgi:hypothetical protein
LKKKEKKKKRKKKGKILTQMPENEPLWILRVENVQDLFVTSEVIWNLHTGIKCRTRPIYSGKKEWKGEWELYLKVIVGGCLHLNIFNEIFKFSCYLGEGRPILWNCFPTSLH